MRIIPQIDRNPRLVAAVQNAPGRIVLLLFFALGLCLMADPFWLTLTVSAAVVAWAGRWRRQALALATLIGLAMHARWINWDFLENLAHRSGITDLHDLDLLLFGSFLVTTAAVALLFALIRRRQFAWLNRRPVFWLVTGFTSIYLLISILAPQGRMALVAWCWVATAIPCLWYYAYALKDAAEATPDGLITQLGTLQPFWGGTFVPFAKGAAYLRKIEAKSPEALAVVQLKGLKLLYWSLLLQKLRRIFIMLVHDNPGMGSFGRCFSEFIGYDFNHLPSLHLPQVDELVLNLHGVTTATAWASMTANLIETLLYCAAFGGPVIALCRLAGFHALRYTYKPLEAQTIASFWNRYDYYFKELLVTFFFYPTFLRFFKKHRELRLAAATLAAATFGNMLVHFLAYFENVVTLGLGVALVRFESFALYSILLGTGIALSQLRENRLPRHRALPPRWRRALNTLAVLLFFAILMVFDQGWQDTPLSSYFRFFALLLGLHV